MKTPYLDRMCNKLRQLGVKEQIVLTTDRSLEELVKDMAENPEGYQEMDAKEDINGHKPSFQCKRKNIHFIFYAIG